MPPDSSRRTWRVRPTPYIGYCDYTRALARRAATTGQAHIDLDHWASMVGSGLRGQIVRHPVLEVFLDTAGRCSIPREYPMELIEGYRMELTHTRYESFSQLLGHCRRTGGKVSQMMAHVVGYRDPALEYMEDLGVAVDLTGNLRDMNDHLSRGRITLPLEEMRAFHYSEADLDARARNDAFDNLMRYQAARIHTYYERAEPGLALLSEKGRFAMKVAFDLYRLTLRRVESSGFDVFRKRAAVPAVARYWITARSMAGPVTRRLWKRGA